MDIDTLIQEIDTEMHCNNQNEIAKSINHLAMAIALQTKIQADNSSLSSNVLSQYSEIMNDMKTQMQHDDFLSKSKDSEGKLQTFLPHDLDPPSININKF